MTDLSGIVKPMRGGAEALSPVSLAKIMFVHRIKALLDGERLRRGRTQTLDSLLPLD